MITLANLDEASTDEMHTAMDVAINELPGEHPVRVLWERLDEMLTAGGPQHLPALWGEYSEPEHTACDTKAGRLTAEAHHLRSAVTNGIGAAIRAGNFYIGDYHRSLRGAADSLPDHALIFIVPALHSLVSLGRFLHPFDVTITGELAVTPETITRGRAEENRHPPQRAHRTVNPPLGPQQSTTVRSESVGTS